MCFYQRLPICSIEIILSNMSEKQNQTSPVLKFRNPAKQAKKSLLKVQNGSSKSLLPEKSSKQITLAPIQTLKHPTYKYLYGTNVNQEDHKKFAKILYQGLFYSVCSLKGPSQDYIRKKSIRLPQRVNSTKKFLMLDLDETLIHSVWKNEKADVTLKCGEEDLRFNVRPHCQPFLQRLSQHYEIYLFTASTLDYAQPIVDYLNGSKKFIQGLLHRSHCMQTQNGMKIKDLRIIRNRSLAQIILVDNLVHSFGLQLDNGIPVLEFKDNTEDRQLLGVQKILMEMRDIEDVRPFLTKKLALKKCLQITQQQFLTIKQKA